MFSSKNTAPERCKLIQKGRVRRCSKHTKIVIIIIIITIIIVTIFIICAGIFHKSKTEPRCSSPKADFYRETFEKLPVV